jgi:hypothetical protein
VDSCVHQFVVIIIVHQRLFWIPLYICTEAANITSLRLVK